jgi:hypothetical protein
MRVRVRVQTLLVRLFALLDALILTRVHVVPARAMVRDVFMRACLRMCSALACTLVCTFGRAESHSRACSACASNGW